MSGVSKHCRGFGSLQLVRILFCWRYRAENTGFVFCDAKEDAKRIILFSVATEQTEKQTRLRYKE
jgi:hypothetical protein